MPNLKLNPYLKLVPKILFIFILGGISGYLLTQKIPFKNPLTKPENKYVSFVSEVYNTINDNYWNKIEEKTLVSLFVRNAETLTSQLQVNKIENKPQLDNLIEKLTNNYDTDNKRTEFVASLVDLVLASLDPAGRSRLYTEKERESLSNNVNNINPSSDLYQNLGLGKKASEDDINKAYQDLSEKYDPLINKSPEAKEKYEQVQKAFSVLSDIDSKDLYDTKGVEPTMEYKLLSPSVFYIHITKFSPTTIDELTRVTKKVEGKDNVDTLILDLTDNVGGAIDGLPFFLGPFIGYDNYAYQFFHRGEKEDYKTRSGWLDSMVQYKKTIVLTNENTQSTAEVMASTLKKYNVGVLVGTKTKGWGTIEKVFPINTKISEKEKFSIFLVHSLTLNENGEPIEGKGIEPNINITNPGWEKDLLSYFNSQEIVNAVKEALLTR